MLVLRAAHTLLQRSAHSATCTAACAAVLQQQLLPELAAFGSAARFSAAADAQLATPPSQVIATTSEADEPRSDLTPREVVDMLDRNIVGQGDAKKAVANALRNRWRRHKIGSPMKEEIVPKNILMIGPTGCGKTEIARRLAKLMDAPFVKVEATKFTEVGFHGRDVDQIIRDLVDNAITLTKAKHRRASIASIQQAVEDKIVDALCGPACAASTKESFRKLYREGALEDNSVEIEVPMAPPGGGGMMHGEGALQSIVFDLGKMMRQNSKSEKRTMKVSEARPLIEETESSKVIREETVQRDAIKATEEDGIVFLDEIDKIVTSHDKAYGADASSEGVQRDLLPIIEGSVVSTKFGNVNTDHILFICSGAFHSVKPSDMLAELQGRLPIRVELQGLTQQDFYRILTEPENNMIRQQQALLKTEDVELQFTDDAIMEVARLAEEINKNVDNIGARRLHTVLERLLDEISFEAPDRVHAENDMAQEHRADGGEGSLKLQVDKQYVEDRLAELVQKQDLTQYIL